MPVNKEIEEMLNALGDPTPKSVEVEDEDKEEKEVEEEKPEEKEEDKAEEKEEKKPEEKEEEEKEEEKKDEEKKEESEDTDSIIANLRAQLEERSKPQPPPKEEKPEEKKEEKKEEPLKLDEQDFVGDMDLDDLTRDKSMLNKLLNAVYSKGVADSKKIATEGVLTTIPDIVKHNITLMTTLAEARDKFYKDNEDLAPFKAVVAAVFEEVAAKNSGKKIEEIMDLVAPEVRTRLQLKKNAVKEEKKEMKKEENAPRLHGTKGGNQRGSQREKPNTSGIAGEIAAMNKALGI